MERSLLILSGGLDSAVSAWLSRETTHPILALTFDYGQRSAKKELLAAAKIASHLKVPHKILRVPWLTELTETALVNPKRDLPRPSEADLDDRIFSETSAAAVWVPNRNGLFLNSAACFAESQGASVLVTGFNAEEGATFPDNSAPFVEAANEFFSFSTQIKVRVVSFTLEMTKAQIARKAKDLGLPIADLWFCYEGGPTPCHTCESCRRDFRAFREAGIASPWEN